MSISMSIQAEQALDVDVTTPTGSEPSASALAEVNAAAVMSPRSRGRRLAERGLTTVEYAIGLVAAAAAALVLLRIFNDNAFFKALFDWVVNVFTSLAGS